jgi:hypothetical protein
MKNSIFIIFLSIVFGFSNISQHVQYGRSFWDTYFARQVHMLFAFSSNSGPNGNKDRLYFLPKVKIWVGGK